jgi:hypothetical protein
MRKDVIEILELLAKNGKAVGSRVTRTDIHRALWPRRMKWCGLGIYRKHVDELMRLMIFDDVAIFEYGPRGGDGLRLVNGTRAAAFAKVGAGRTAHNA